MKKIIKYCLVAVLSLVHFQSCAHEEPFVDDQIILTEEIEKYVNEDVASKDPVFIFDPERWGIVQGRVSDDVALKNREIINGIITKLSEMGIYTMEIGAMDAYFEVGSNPGRENPAEKGIRVPSNFHLKMSNETYLRVQPTHMPAYGLITLYVTDNTIISGGNLIGDRWEHDYTPIIDDSGVNRKEHGWGHLIYIIGSHNTVVDGVVMEDVTGDAIQIRGEGLRNPDGTVKPGQKASENVLIKNCTIKESRRNGVAIIDGKDIIIDNCEILDTGKGEQAYDSSGNKIFSSAGVKPKYGIDLEGERHVNEDGTLNEYNKIEYITIRNSRFTGNVLGDIDLFTCSYVTVENNYFDNMVANLAAHEITIRNNTFEAAQTGNGNAINIASYFRDGMEFNYNYKIYGNTIIGYGNGILMGGKNQDISNNIVKNCVSGIVFRHDLIDSSFSNNTIESSMQYSYGYKCNNTQNVSNIYIVGETVNVDYRALSLVRLNSDGSVSNKLVTFDGCVFNNTNQNFKLSVNKSKNVEFKNNVSNTDFEIIDSENIILENNTVNN